MQTRRGVLLAFGTATTALAGCSTLGEPTTTPLNPAEVDLPRHTYEESLDVTPTPDANPAVALEYGSSSDSHWVYLLAESPEREVPVSVHQAGREPLYADEVVLSPASFAAFHLREPADYVLRAGGAGAEVNISKLSVDCNDSHTAVLLDSNGDLHEMSVSTMMACGN